MNRWFQPVKSYVFKLLDLRRLFRGTVSDIHSTIYITQRFEVITDTT